MKSHFYWLSKVGYLYNTLIISVLCFIFVVFCSIGAHATHSAGADLSYKCLGGLDYEITATFYRDCDGINEPTSVMIDYVSNSCGYVRAVSAYKVPSSGEEITTPCPSASTACTGGSLVGITKWVYKALVTLPAACHDWRFSYKVCCRNCAITTILNPCQNGSNLYVEATLDNINAPCNSSPTFTNSPVAFVCVGQSFNYNPGLFDIDGDSIEYEIIDPKTGTNTNVTWLQSSSVISPLSSSTPFTVNSQNGSMNFTPDQFQIGVITSRVKEYRNGLLIGSTIRDMQVYTQMCNNTIPSLTGINGSQDFNTCVCAGTQLCFDIQSFDPDLAQDVTIFARCSIPGSTITITPGARPSLHFCWTPNITHVRTTPHNFTVIVRDNACPTNAVQIYNYSILVSGLEVTTSGIDVSCFGGSDGVATVDVTDASSTINWNTIPPVHTNTMSNLSMGTYQVSVNLGSGCTILDSVVIDQPDKIDPQLTLTTLPCQAPCTGTGSVSTQNVASFNYLWSNGSTTHQVANICNGVHTVTVTDQNGCSEIISDTLFAKNAFEVNSTVQHTGCLGDSSGAIQLNISGGSPPFSFNWTGPYSGSSISNLVAGNYNVVITDANGCSASGSYEVNGATSSLEAQVKNIQHVLCKGSKNGYAEIYPSGGTPPYNYQWSDGNNSNTNSALSAANYTVTVSDDKGCRVEIDFDITEPAQLLSGLINNIDQVSCYGGYTGGVDLTVTGGVSPYLYNWSNGSVLEDLIGIPSGSFQVIITDHNGCLDTVQVFVPQPDSALFVNVVTVKDVVCYAQLDGILESEVSGGVQPYTYLWSNGKTATAITDLHPGEYSVIVTDKNGCTFEAHGLIEGPKLPLTVSSSVTNSECLAGSFGSAEIFPFGGTPGYSVLWDNGNTGFIETGLTSGNYDFTITDSKGCIITSTLEIIDNSEMKSVHSPDPVCEGGIATLEVEQLTGFNYLWFYNGNSIPGATNHIYSTPAAGNYWVQVSSSSCGKFLSDTMQVIVNTVENVSVSASPTICPPQSATLNASGGISYEWLPKTNINFTDVPDPLVNPGKTTVYSVKITDDNGCFKTLTVPVLVMCDSLLIPTGFSPNNDGINDGYVIENIDLFPGNQIWVFNSLGSLVFNQKNYDNKWDGRANAKGTFNGKYAPQGTYFYILDLADGSKPRSGYIIIRR